MNVYDELTTEELAERVRSGAAQTKMTGMIHLADAVARRLLALEGKVQDYVARLNGCNCDTCLTLRPGPAAPEPAPKRDPITPPDVMNLRDTLAMAALAIPEREWRGGSRAVAAYYEADAMLEARKMSAEQIARLVGDEDPRIRLVDVKDLASNALRLPGRDYAAMAQYLRRILERAQ